MIGFGDARSTIVAIASATAPALRGVVRIAGDEAIEILQKFVVGPLELPSHPAPVSVRLRLAPPLAAVDAVAFVWPTAKSYTGCPSVEIHTHGSLPILEAIVTAATSAGARPAGPGEFTMRAFMNGRLDLTQAEAVLGVIDATNRKQLNAALTQLAGNVSAPLREARHQLLDMLADLEAGLDFVEEDISFIDDQTVRDGLESVLALIDSTSNNMKSNRRSESHYWVVLRGLPNAGKSSLLNALANHSIAIVSDQAGTTRDVVWKELSMGDYRVRIADTAGEESGVDEISVLSQLAAADIQAAAKILVQCRDVNQWQSTASPISAPGCSLIRVATKADSIGADQEQALIDQGWIVTSSVTGKGLTAMREAIVSLLATALDANDNGVPGTAARCADAIDRAAKSLRTAIQLLATSGGHELIAAEIRETLEAIGEVTGEIYTDDILDRVFSRFCIGK
jgi:tRNA modification GTPase